MPHCTCARARGGTGTTPLLFWRYTLPKQPHFLSFIVFCTDLMFIISLQKCWCKICKYKLILVLNIYIFTFWLFYLKKCSVFGTFTPWEPFRLFLSNCNRFSHMHTLKSLPRCLDERLSLSCLGAYEVRRTGQIRAPLPVSPECSSSNSIRNCGIAHRCRNYPVQKTIAYFTLQ